MPNDDIHVIEDDSYRETRALLKTDPIIRDMAREARIAGADPDGIDMGAALQEYKRRGGNIPTHIGGPVQVIRELMAHSPGDVR